jgi:hypothetical protein
MMANKITNSSVWGAKKPMQDPAVVLKNAEFSAATLRKLKVPPLKDIRSVQDYFIEHSRHYYSLAALSRRKELDERDRKTALSKLFPLRSSLETRMLEGLTACLDSEDVFKTATKPSFFGKSIKQGVSIRYPLDTCVPTKVCGGRCYAHDGRDRDLQRVFRGVLNGYLGRLYEGGGEDLRKKIIASLSKGIDEAVLAARRESELADLVGFSRSPRIRFSHVGEMAATPFFANALGSEIMRRAPDIALIFYTRHPSASRLDSAIFVVNFTVDGADDPRITYRPSTARLVSSSWDGLLFDGAEVNFIEHHVRESRDPSGSGSSCPVTLHHLITPSCDSARCDRCFVPLKERPDGRLAGFVRIEEVSNKLTNDI